MNKLPLEIKEQIVGRTIWAPRPYEPNSEKWEDGSLKLELAEFHPLPHYLAARGENKIATTDAEKALAALMRTSKEFKRICERFTRELLSAHGTLESGCECDFGGGSCGLREAWGISVSRGRPGAHVKVLQLTHVDDDDTADAIWQGSWPDSALPTTSPFRQCSSLSALSLGAFTLGWLPAVVDALPGNGTTLEQLKLVYPEWDDEPSDAELAVVLAAIGRCTNLQVLDAVQQGNDWPRDSKSTTFAFKALASLSSSLVFVRLSFFKGSGTIGGMTPSGIVRQPLPLAITRLSLQHIQVLVNVISTLAESCSKTLEYLAVDQTLFCTMPSGTARDSLPFPRLYHLQLEQPEWVDEAELGPTVSPEHWSLPAIRHVECRMVLLSVTGSVKTFTSQLRSWSTLRYARIAGYWSWGVFFDDLMKEDALTRAERDEEEDDVRFEWVTTLQSAMKESGVDVKLDLEGY